MTSVVSRDVAVGWISTMVTVLILPVPLARQIAMGLGIALKPIVLVSVLIAGALIVRQA